MLELLNTIINFLVGGGTTAIIVILFSVIVYLIWERRYLGILIRDTTQKVFDAKDSETKSIKEIVDRYHRGNLDLVQALNEIKIVLVTIQNVRE